jgi:hypothetical protein
LAERSIRRAALIATAATLPILVIALVLLSSDPKSKPSNPTTKPLSAVSVPAPPPNSSADAPCTTLLGDLPTSIPTSNGTLAQRPAESTWTYVAAWGDPAIVLRCGVPRPKELVPNSSVLLVPVNGVAFLPVNTKKVNVFTTVDRAAYIEITVPTSYPQPPLGPLADAITKALQAVCLPQAGPGQPAVDPTKLCSRRP